MDLKLSPEQEKALREETYCMALTLAKLYLESLPPLQSDDPIRDQAIEYISYFREKDFPDWREKYQVTNQISKPNWNEL